MNKYIDAMTFHAGPGLWHNAANGWTRKLMATMRMTTVSIMRLRAGFLVLLALAFISFMAGRWTATLLSLGWGWAAMIGLAVAALIALVLTRLDRVAYLIVAATVTLFGAFSAYDFARGPVDWSQGWALMLALVPSVLLGLAFWDFRNLMRDVRIWLNARN